MGGDILLQNGGGRGCFSNNGHFGSGDAVQVGQCGVSNSGTFDVKGSATGTTKIVGGFTQQAGGVLNIDADLANGIADKLEITGSATLGGTVHVAPTSISNQAVTIVSATGGVTLDPQLRQTDEAALFDFPLIASGNELKIQAVARFNNAAANLGANQQAVAGHLQGLFDSGASLGNGFTALGALAGGSAVAQSLDTLGGHALGAIGAFRYISSRGFVDTLNTGCSKRENPSDGATCVWARARVIDAKQDANTDELGYDANAQAYQLGMEKEVGSDLFLGASAAYEHGKFRDEERTARVRGNVLLAGLGLRYQPGAWELSGAIDGGYGWYTSRRTIAVGSLSDIARAKPNAWQFGAHLRAAYTLDLGTSAYVKPFAEVHAIYVHANGFTETGSSPFNLDVARQNDFAVTGGAGLELGTRIALGGGTVLRPFLSGALEVNGAADWTTQARFASQPQAGRFAVTTAAPNLIGRFAIGADLISAKNLDLSVSYSPAWGEDFHSNSGTARITWRF